MVIIVISIIGVGYTFWNALSVEDKQCELTDCYLRITDLYLEYKQLVNGEYQIGKIFIPEVNHIMKVEKGFQIWFDSNSGNSIYKIDEEIVNIDTVCIYFYGFDTDEYIDLYLAFIDKTKETNKNVELELYITDWKDEVNIKEWIKLLLPSLLYLIPVLINIFHYNYRIKG